VIIFFTVPVIALFSWLLFKRKGKNYAEYLTLAAFVSGERSIFFTIIVAPLWIFFKEYYFMVLYIYLGLYFLYYSIAIMQFTRQYTAWAFIKGLIANLIVQSIVSAIIITCIKIYYRYYFPH